MFYLINYSRSSLFFAEGFCGRIPRKDFQCRISICGRIPRKDFAEGCGRIQKITDFFVGRSSRKDLCGRIPRKGLQCRIRICGRIPRKDFQCGMSIYGRSPRKDFAEGFRKDPRKDPRGRKKGCLFFAEGFCGRIPRKDFQCRISICGRVPRKDFAEGCGRIQKNRLPFCWPIFAEGSLRKDLRKDSGRIPEVHVFVEGFRKSFSREPSQKDSGRIPEGSGRISL